MSYSTRLPVAPEGAARPTEADIRRFVERFYAAVRQDPELGPIFDARIAGAWPEHLDRMVDFWSSILLGSARYRGNPLDKHAAVPEIRSAHYDRWLALFETVLLAELAEPIARDVVARAHRMRLVLDRSRAAAASPPTASPRKRSPPPWVVAGGRSPLASTPGEHWMPEVRVTRRLHFSAAHRLFRKDWSDARNADVFGDCSSPNWHGHNYELEVTVTGQVDPETGFVMDLKELRDLVEERVVGDVDHKNLNLDVAWMKDVLPSTENLVVAIWNRIEGGLPAGVRLERVLLQETPRNFVEYTGG